MDNLQDVPPGVLLLTGLSGAGKTTIANALIFRLKEKGVTPVLLDGDEIRKAIQVTGFDEAARKKHNLSVGSLASMLEMQGHFVIVALIAPYEDIRKQIRSMCKKFIEIYVSTDIKICIERDTKGLYKKAIEGEINDFTGISAPYQPPQNPDLTLDTALLPLDDCVAKIFDRLLS